MREDAGVVAHRVLCQLKGARHDLHVVDD